MKGLVPRWPVDGRVQALATTRSGGVSLGPWAHLNLGEHCGDDPLAVAENRRILARQLPGSPHWLNQVHGRQLVHLDDWAPGVAADAAWTDRPGQVLAILTADCLPVLLARTDGTLAAAVHAGWRGLAAGILERVVAELPCAAEQLCAWIGPGISAPAYAVDELVRSAMTALDPRLASAFQPDHSGGYRADLKAIASQRLRRAGVGHVVDAKLCTFSDPVRFFSHRRDGGRTGRQATLIWLTGARSPGAMADS